MSADARTAISIYLCNLFLNWLIILPVFCCAVLGMKILAVLLDGLMTVRNPVSMQWLQNFLGPKYFEIELSCLAFKDRGIEINWVTYVLWCGLLGVILLLTALAFVSRHLVFRSDLSNPEAGASQKGYLFCAILPSVLSAILLAQLLGSDPFSRMFEKLTEVGCDAITLTRNVAGVPIADVHKTGPAENAKLQKGDIIVKFDGNPIKSEGDLEYYLRKKTSGDEVLLDVERENEPAAVLKLVLPLVTPDRNRGKSYPVIEDLKFITAKADALEPRFSSYWFLFGGGVLGAIVYSLGLLAGWASSFRRGEVSIPVFLAWVVSGSVYGAMLGFAFYLFVTTPGGTSESKMLVDSPALPLTFGVPWILSSQLLAQIVFVGLSSRRSGSLGSRMAGPGRRLDVGRHHWLVCDFMSDIWGTVVAVAIRLRQKIRENHNHSRQCNFRHCHRPVKQEQVDFRYSFPPARKERLDKVR